MIIVNLNKAKAIAHEHRRTKRSKLFAPYDEVISKQIPGKDFTAAEKARAAIRDDDAKVQASIDAVSDPVELKEILSNYGAIPFTRQK